MKHEIIVSEQLQVQNSILETKKKEAMDVLNKLYGSVKPKRMRMSKTERDKLAIEFTEEDSMKIAKEFKFRN